MLSWPSKTRRGLDSLGALRARWHAAWALIDEGKWEFLWVTDFPLLEYDEEQGRYVAMPPSLHGAHGRGFAKA